MTLKKFLIQLAILAGFILAIFLGIMLWLNIYTNHGQQLELPDYIEQQLDDAEQDAMDKSFQIIVNDSTHRVGIPGGRIIEQNPKGGSMVKENRKIYVTITKYLSDKIALKNLPDLYGRNYERKKKELKGIEIKAEIVGHKFDSGAPGHILEVLYNGKTIVNAKGRSKGVKIDKGDTLGFIVSKKTGGEFDVPDLECHSMSGLQFYLESLKLNIGTVQEDGDITDPAKAKIIRQYPPHGAGSTILMGEAINVTISENSKLCPN